MIFVAKCATPAGTCRGVWLNVLVGWLRVWPLGRDCWGRAMSHRFMGIIRVEGYIK